MMSFFGVFEWLLIALVLLAPLSVLQAEEAAPELDLEEWTVDEKASLTTGKSMWETRDLPERGLAPVWMADGPVGLRKSTGMEVSESLPATCFPSAAAMAATWNAELVERVGAAIGAEARAHGVTLLLGPGLNLKRHPLGGRNFEYYSEDPLLGGLLAAAFVRGVQSTGVGATVKHFAVNNQEHRRMLIDARVAERPLRELYLRGFEIAVREGRPAAVMCAYNRVNGTAASANGRLLTEILRGEWGFDGLVVSDWGAVDDPAAALAAGLDLEMPGNPLTPPRVAKAVADGKLAAADLDRAAANVLQLAARQAALGEPSPVDDAAHHELAREAAAEAVVLLANDGLLPLGPDAPRRVGVLGKLAFAPRIQGVGSSQINPLHLDVPWTFIDEIGRRQGHDVAAWESGYAEAGLSADERDGVRRFVAGLDVALVFAGQPASHDAEAWDRPSASLAPADRELMAAVREAGKPFAAVLVGGGAMDVSALDADALLMGWLGGQGFGGAVAEVLFGERSPSGKLSETFAHEIADHPSAINFPGGPHAVDYGEGLYVGYRYFQTFGRDVAFPFGHGLSYTTFEYADAAAPTTLDSLDAGFDVTVTVTNTGERRGAETVQVYLRHLDPSLPRPDRELAGFRKLALEPGESRRFTIHVDADRLAYYHDVHGRWVIEPGRYEVLVAASAADVRATLPLEVTAGTLPPTLYTLDHTLGELYADRQGRAIVDFILEQMRRPPLSESAPDDFMAAVFRDLPFRKLANFSGGAVTPEILHGLLFMVNGDMDPAALTEMLRQSRPPPRSTPGPTSSPSTSW